MSDEPPSTFHRKLKQLVDSNDQKQDPIQVMTFGVATSIRLATSGLGDLQGQVRISMLLGLLVQVCHATATREGWWHYTPPQDHRTPYSAAGFVPIFCINEERKIMTLLHNRKKAIREAAHWAPSVNFGRCVFAQVSAGGSNVSQTCGSGDWGWAGSLGGESAEASTFSQGAEYIQCQLGTEKPSEIPHNTDGHISPGEDDPNWREIGKHVGTANFFRTSAWGGSRTTRTVVPVCRGASDSETHMVSVKGLNRPNYKTRSKGCCQGADSGVHCSLQGPPESEKNSGEILVDMTDWTQDQPMPCKASGVYPGHDGYKQPRACLMVYLEPSIIPSLAPAGAAVPAPTEPYSDDPGVNLEGYIDSLNPKGPTNLNGNVTKSVRGWVHGYAPGRTPAMHQQMDDLVEKHRDSGFSWSLKDLGCYTGPLGPVEFPLEDENKRFYAHPRRSPFHEKVVEDEKVPPLIEAGIVVEVPASVAASKYASNSVIAWKKDSEGAYTEKRYCHNYKPINTGLLSTSARLPRIDQLLADVSKSRYFSRLDARSGFMALPVIEKDQPKTAFWYNRKLYMYKFMPFGLKTAPTLFQERMEHAIEDAGLAHCCCIYIDDCLCYLGATSAGRGQGDQHDGGHRHEVPPCQICLWGRSYRVSGAQSVPLGDVSHRGQDRCNQSTP